MIASFDMDPRAVRTFTVDWTRWPFPSGTRIASIEWVVPPDFKILQQSVLGYLANVKLDYIGQWREHDYIVECHMTTNDPNVAPFQDSRRFGIGIKPR